MTRAKQSLSLLAPLKFHVIQQPPGGDRHVYGARSRFLSDSLMQKSTVLLPYAADEAEAAKDRSGSSAA